MFGQEERGTLAPNIVDLSRHLHNYPAGLVSAPPVQAKRKPGSGDNVLFAEEIIRMVDYFRTISECLPTIEIGVIIVGETRIWKVICTRTTIVWHGSSTTAVGTQLGVYHLRLSLLACLDSTPGLSAGF